MADDKDNKILEEAKKQQAALDEEKQKRLLDLIDKEAAATSEFKKKLETLKELNKESIQEASLLTKKTASLEAQQKVLQSEIAYAKEQIRLSKELLNTMGAQTRARKDLQEEISKEERALRGLIKESDKLTVAINRRTKADAEATEASKNVSAGISNMAQSITGWNKNVGASIGNVNTMKGAMHGLLKSVASLATPTGIINVFASFAAVVAQAVIDVDKAQHAFARAAGSAGKLREVFYGLREETMGTHLEANELTAGLIELRQGMTAFDGLTTRAATSTAVLAAQLDKLGFSFADQTKIMQFMNLTMRQTVGEAQRSVQELYAMAEASGQGPAKLAADFQTAAPILAVYGTKMTNEFRKMSSLSRETGIEMGKLIGIVGQMDTFEGAAAVAVGGGDGGGGIEKARTSRARGERDGEAEGVVAERAGSVSDAGGRDRVGGADGRGGEDDVDASREE